MRWLCVVLVVCALPSAAVAAPALNGSFDVSGMPQHLALGSDGNVWFTLSSSSASKEFGRVTPGGTVTEYDAPGTTAPIGITTGPDGKLFMSASGNIVKVDPANPTAGTAIANLNIVQAQTIVVGPDGNLWTASADKIFKIGLDGNEILHYTVPGLSARGIAAGGDGNIWVADLMGKRVLRAPTTGVGDPTTKFDAGGGVQEIAPGPAGQLGLTAPQDAPFYIGRINFAGNIQKTEVPTGTDPTGIVFAKDGAYWTPEFGKDKVGRLTTTGVHTQLAVPAGSGPRHITKGPGDTLWVGFQTSNKIARISGVSAPPGGSTTPPPPPVGPVPDVTAPVVSGFALRPRVIRRRPARVGYGLSEAATVRFTVQRLRKGRRVRRRCVRPTRANANRKRCTRRTRARAFTRAGAVGANRLSLGRRGLKPGRYRLLLVARDAAGNASKPQSRRFRVARLRRG